MPLTHLSAHRFPGVYNLVLTRGGIETGCTSRSSGSARRKGSRMATFLWVLLSIFYVVILLTLGLTTLRKGHMFLFIVGIFVPVFWLIGALIGPTPRTAGAQ